MPMKDNIQAESAGPGRGATFTVTLPLAETQQASNAAEPSGQNRQPVNKSVRILLVDDHEDTLEFMSRFLTLCGHKVVTASTYEKALSVGQTAAI